MPLRIALLGPPRIEIGDRPLVVDTRKAIALLAYLAVVRRPIARDSLVELLWPEADRDDGRGALRRTLSTLRSALGGAWLEVDRRQVALSADDVMIDVSAFRAGLASGDPAALGEAVRTFRGEFLEGFGLRDSPAFDEWQMLEAEALRGELALALRRLVEVSVAGGRQATAVEATRRLLALDPLDEDAHRSLMRLHAGAGDRAAVARQYRTCVRALEQELGIEPDLETTSLYRSLVEAPVAVPAAGTHRAPEPLGSTARSLLEAAAILESADPDLAADVAGVDGAEAASGFDELVSAGILREPPSGASEQAYRFETAATREAVLGSLGLARRRRLHRSAAAALEARLRNAPADTATAALLATQLAAAGETARAADVHHRAAEAARRLSAHGEAAAHLRAAVSLGHPDRLALLEGIGDVETLRGRYGEALAAYEQAAALAGPAEVARLEQRLGSLHLRRGGVELAELHLSAALARLGGEPSALRARVLADQSLAAVRRNDARGARRLATGSLREARTSRDRETESQAENLLAMLARRAGDNGAARRHLRRSLELAGLADDAGARVAALNHLALLERAAGNLEDALALTEEALRRCTVLGDRHREAALRNNRADLLHALGRPREAIEELARSVTAFVDVGDRDGLEPEIWKLVEW